MLPFRVRSDPNARDVLRAFGRDNAALTNSLALVEPGTNQWILQDEHVAAWLSGKPDTNWVAPGQDYTVKTINKLWLYGPSGTGRTLVAATLVDELLQRHKSEPRLAVCYYLAEHSHQADGHVRCLRTLVAQLAQQSDAAYTDFGQWVSKGVLPSAQAIEGESPVSFDADNVEHLYSLLETMSRRFDRVSLVVKSVDYMPSTLAVRLSNIADAVGSSVKIVFTSSDGEGQQDICMQTISCPVEIAASAEDLRLYLRNKVHQRIADGAAYLQDDATRASIEEYIVNNNHGSWLWAVTVFEDQCDMLRRGIWRPPVAGASEESDIRSQDGSRLAFDPYLLRIMQDTNPMPKFILVRVAHWLSMTFNRRTFSPTATETCKALTVLFRREDDAFRESDRIIQTQDVLDACRPIVRLVVEENTPYFMFSHTTVYGYLLTTVASYDEPLKSIAYTGYTTALEFKDFVPACNGLRKTDARCAESLFKQVLATQREAFGPDDAETLFTQEHLASFFWDEGRLEEAEKLFLEIMRGYEREPPYNREPQYNVLNQLGIFYKRQGRFEEAEHYYQASLRGREAYLGPSHESTLMTVNNIALMYAAQDKDKIAQSYWAKVLPLYEETFGPRDTRTLAIVYNLGLTHKSLGEYDDAERMLTRALTEHEEEYGVEHKDTLDIVAAMGHLYILQRDDAAAEAMYIRSLASCERIHGRDSEPALHACHSLAKIYQSTDRMGEAEMLCERALHGFEAARGFDDSTTVDVAYTLFLGYIDENRLREAAELGPRVLAGFEKEGPGRREGITAAVADHLALTHAKLGELDSAEPLWMRAYEDHVASRGEDHELALSAANNLGLLFMRQSRLPAAEEWLLRSLRGYEALQGRKGETALRIAMDLSSVYKDMGRMEESDDMASRAYQ